jgi:dTDP-glucose 4,6-dehydratase
MDNITKHKKMDWKGKRVLVTGAGGFIGSHLTERLVELGAKVRAFIRYNSRGSWGWLDTLPNYIKNEIEIFMGDLLDIDSVRNSLKDIEIVFHLGCIISIPYSYTHPREIVDVNIGGTYNILECARHLNIEKIIHTSSSEVYGTAKYVPIDEEHPLQAQSPYSATKIGADKIVESFYYSFNLPVCIIRPFNTYGPRQSARAIIPTIITQALTQKEIFLGALHPTRDFTYVEDTVEGFIKMAENNTVGKIINIGTGIETSINKIAETIIEIVGGKCRIIFDATRVRPELSEVERLCADIKKAKKILKWEPKFSLKEGLEKTVEWFSQNLHFYKPNIYNI